MTAVLPEDITDLLHTLRDIAGLPGLSARQLRALRRAHGRWLLPAPSPSARTPPPLCPPVPLDQRAWVRLSEAAMLMDVTPKTIITWREQGLLPHAHLGPRGWRYPRTDLIRFIECHVPSKHRGVDYAATRRALFT